MAFWHRAHPDECFLSSFCQHSPLFTAGKRGVLYCHETSWRLETTNVTSIVYGCFGLLCMGKTWITVARSSKQHFVLLIGWIYRKINTQKNVAFFCNVTYLANLFSRHRTWSCVLKVLHRRKSAEKIDARHTPVSYCPLFCPWSVVVVDVTLKQTEENSAYLENRATQYNAIALLRPSAKRLDFSLVSLFWSLVLNKKNQLWFNFRKLSS
jgi:hypothetical protein